MGDLIDNQLLTGDEKTVIEMISDRVPKLIEDQFDWPSNVRGKTRPYSPNVVFLEKLFRQEEHVPTG